MSDQSVSTTQKLPHSPRVAIVPSNASQIAVFEAVFDGVNNIKDISAVTSLHKDTVGRVLRYLLLKGEISVEHDQGNKSDQKNKHIYRYCVVMQRAPLHQASVKPFTHVVQPHGEACA